MVMKVITKSLAAIPRFVVRIATTLGVLSALAAVAAAVNPRWIEDLLGFSPDAGSGEAELGLVYAFGAAALVLLATATAAMLAARSIRALETAHRTAGADGGQS
jgi:hypothetical protein